MELILGVCMSVYSVHNNIIIHCDSVCYLLCINYNVSIIFILQSYMYNFGDEIKEAIAEDFFEGFKVIGQMGLYLTLYDSIGGGYLSNQGGVSHYLSYFKSLVTNIVKNTCEWVGIINLLLNSIIITKLIPILILSTVKVLW